MRIYFGRRSRARATPATPLTRARRAWTLVELLVVLAVIALFAACLTPALRSVHRAAGDDLSAANLAALGAAHAAYAGDWDDRQVQWIPDNAGAAGSCAAYIATFGCPPQFILGADSSIIPAIWGYYLGCGGFRGSCGNWTVYKPANLIPGVVFGSFRLANAKAFHDYVDGKFYSETFYSPYDFATQQGAKPGLNLPGEFNNLPGTPNIVNSTYCLSPAAMWHPDVLSLNPATQKHFSNPDVLAHGYTSPTVSQATYPDLKTRMLEHNWCVDPPSEVNPAFAGNMTPWFFNHGLAATPVTLFFDGHVAELSTGQAFADDAKVQSGGAAGLWSRDTPLGASGYYGNQSFDGTKVSYHLLTIDGILGRDVLSPKR